MHPCAPAVLLCVSLTACAELFCCLVCFLKATTQRPHHGWILGAETKPPGLWKSVTMMVSFYTALANQKYAFTLLCSGLETVGGA